MLFVILLQIGDEILKVNGMILDESIHDEVVNVLKNKRSLTFVTRSKISFSDFGKYFYEVRFYFLTLGNISMIKSIFGFVEIC